MHGPWTGIVVALCVSLLVSPTVPAQEAGDLAGEWMGTIDAGIVPLRIVVAVEHPTEGGLAATFNSVDQGASLPVPTITVENGTLRFAIPQIDGSYEGRVRSDGQQIVGTWRQGGRSFPLSLERLDEPFSLNRPQHPKPPFPYTTEDIEVRNESAEIALACTLSVPPGTSRFPTVLFLSGSGAQDRDETLMGHRPFLVIADHLARRGVASLRCDDRGVGGSEGNVFLSSLDDQAGDAEAAIGFLASHPAVNRDRLGLLGHSEGALLAPLVASRNERVGFLVLLAPPGVPMADLVLRQARDLMESRGVDPELIRRALEDEADELVLIANPSVSREELVARLEARAEKRRRTFAPEELAALNLTDQEVAQAIQQVATPWFRSLLRQDPGAFLSRVDIPVLALFGSKDLQVAADVNAPAVERALDRAPTSNVTVRVLPGLNHLFQHATSGAIEEYGRLEETFAPEALKAIVDWIASVDRLSAERKQP